MVSRGKDVAIVGGGISGLSTAIYLRHLGYNINVFEATEKFDSLGPGILLSPLGIDILSELDLLWKVRENAALIREVRVERSPAQPLLTWQYRNLRANAFALGISRFALLSTLRREAERLGVRIHFRNLVHGLEPFSDGVHLDFKHHRLEGYDFAILATGARSNLLNPLTLRRFERESAQRIFWNVGVLADCSSSRILHRHGNGGLSASLLPLGEGQVGFAWVPANNTLFPARDQFLRQVEALIPEALPLLEPLRGLEELRHSTISSAINFSWRRKNILLIGDAAHPSLGSLQNGAAWAMVDAARLAFHLREAGGNTDIAFREFERERSWRMLSSTVIAECASPLLAPRTRLGTTFRNFLCPTIARIPPLKNALFSAANGLHASTPVDTHTAGIRVGRSGI